MTQICGLCLNCTSVVGELCQSHIIPKFMLKRSKDRKTGRAVIFGNGQIPKEGQFDWKERLFCADCEFKLKFYEDFMQETFFLHRKKAILSDNTLSVTLYGSNNLMALALLSIFWRAITSSLPEFRFMMLPEYIIEPLRNWILNRNIPVKWEKLLIIRLSILVDSEGEPVRFTFTPRVRQLPNKFAYAFAFAGYFVELTIPPDSNDIFGKFSLRQGSQYVRVKKIDYRSVPEISILFNN